MREKLFEAAKAVLDANWNGQFTKPAPHLYPHQWNWDAGFIALGLAHFNMDRAEVELLNLFDAQWSNGMLPQIVFGQETKATYFPGPSFWQTEKAQAVPPHVQTSGITMPPVHGFVLLKLYEIAKDKKRALNFLKKLYPKVLKLHRYLYNFRDPLEEGLVYIRHPWESGTDNSPAWDPVLERIDTSKLDIPSYQRQDLQAPAAAIHRPTDLDYDRYVHLVDIFRRAKYNEEEIYQECSFLVQDPLFNAILVWSNEALIEIGSMLKEDVAEIIQWNEWAIYGINEKLWNEEKGIYHAYDLRNDCIIDVPTSSGIMPLIGEIPTQDQAEQILKTLGTQFGGTQQDIFFCPTYSLDAENIDFQKYWRGPVWINMNWMLYHGLLRYDFDHLAAKLKSDSLELLEHYGFFEYFDPRRSAPTSRGYGTNHFSWSAALCIDFLMQSS